MKIQYNEPKRICSLQNYIYRERMSFTLSSPQMSHLLYVLNKTLTIWIYSSSTEKCKKQAKQVFEDSHLDFSRETIVTNHTAYWALPRTSQTQISIAYLLSVQCSPMVSNWCAMWQVHVWHGALRFLQLHKSFAVSVFPAPSAPPKT